MLETYSRERRFLQQLDTNCMFSLKKRFTKLQLTVLRLQPIRLHDTTLHQGLLFCLFPDDISLDDVITQITVYVYDDVRTNPTSHYFII